MIQRTDMHADKHKHTCTHNNELCVGSQALVTHVLWAQTSYEEQERASVMVN